MTENVPHRSRIRWRGTVRGQMVLAMMTLSAVALATAGYATFWMQRASVDARVDNYLDTASRELHLLAEEGVDPQTGGEFASPADFVRTAMARSLPGENAGMVGFVGSEPAFVPRDADVRVEDDAALMEALVPLLETTTVAAHTVSTEQTTYRLVVVPVRVSSDTDGVGDQAEPGAIVVAYDLEAARETVVYVTTRYAWIGLSALAVVSLIAWLLAGSILRPVRLLAFTANSLGRDDLDARIPVRGDDELADMTLAVNTMLGRLEEAFAAQDQLVDDVSHELRTPLTVIRGHMEVLDTGNTQDVEATRTLVIDEVDRMDRLVGDLLTLAKADAPAFVTRTPIEVGVLTDEVYDRSRALSEHDWRVAHRVDATLRADQDRLLQAWLQLAANAAKFSPPGSRIDIASRIDAGRVELSVRDRGAGIAPEDSQRIFERFARANAGKQEGAGLGLPIVRAIALAHGGDVDVRSRLGKGTTMTLWIPMEVAS